VLCAHALQLRGRDFRSDNLAPNVRAKVLPPRRAYKRLEPLLPQRVEQAEALACVGRERETVALDE
jgi:hypothetical protein